MPLRRFVGLGLLLAMLTACSPRTTPQATATRAQPTSTSTPADGKLQMGFTAEGWPYRGNPDAAVTLWDFSEFQ